MGYLPENTLPSFEYAVSLGCEYIELDVHYVSGQLLVYTVNEAAGQLRLPPRSS